jgi:hypothetical protein
MKRNKIFIVLVLGLMLSGCSSSWHIKKARKICPECFEMDTTITELVIKKDTIIRLDTLILVALPPDTIKIDSLIFKTLKPNIKPFTKKEGIITTKVEMIRGRLFVTSFLDSTYLYRLRESIRIKDAQITILKKESVKQTVIIEKQNKLIKWVKIVSVWLICSIVVAASIKLCMWVCKKK